MQGEFDTVKKWYFFFCCVRMRHSHSVIKRAHSHQCLEGQFCVGAYAFCVDTWAQGNTWIITQPDSKTKPFIYSWPLYTMSPCMVIWLYNFDLISFCSWISCMEKAFEISRLLLKGYFLAFRNIYIYIYLPQKYRRQFFSGIYIQVLPAKSELWITEWLPPIQSLLQHQSRRNQACKQ